MLWNAWKACQYFLSSTKQTWHDTIWCRQPWNHHISLWKERNESIVFTVLQCCVVTCFDAGKGPHSSSVISISDNQMSDVLILLTLQGYHLSFLCSAITKLFPFPKLFLDLLISYPLVEKNTLSPKIKTSCECSSYCTTHFYILYYCTSLLWSLWSSHPIVCLHYLTILNHDSMFVFSFMLLFPGI